MIINLFIQGMISIYDKQKIIYSKMQLNQRKQAKLKEMLQIMQAEK